MVLPELGRRVPGLPEPLVALPEFVALGLPVLEQVEPLELGMEPRGLEIAEPQARAKARSVAAHCAGPEALLWEPLPEVSEYLGALIV